MSKKKTKDEETCPLCGKRADCIVKLANGFIKSVHGYKWIERVGMQGGVIDMQVADKVCTNDKTEFTEDEDF